MKFFIVLIILVSIAWISLDKLIEIGETQVANLQYKIDTISRELSLDTF